MFAPTKTTNHFVIFASKTLLFSLLLFWNSIKLSLNEFYIYPLAENVAEPTDGGDEGDAGDD
ncbi:hypothetical protein A6769_09505 [Nostoc punctiforme NIES-2108]|uniref:Uncharacterized protein n=1 Tax=Nostoc punctiforme NIES-2108 TaxID=1356359 RepID=A0A367RPZ1_NOSPU|nr:hypothetical protein A6769_09505 [Nostoc punctiforme NIES-2108]